MNRCRIPSKNLGIWNYICHCSHGIPKMSESPKPQSTYLLHHISRQEFKIGKYIGSYCSCYILRRMRTPDHVKFKGDSCNQQSHNLWTMQFPNHCLASRFLLFLTHIFQAKGKQCSIGLINLSRTSQQIYHASIASILGIILYSSVINLK